MKIIDELFSDKSGTGMFHDAVFEATAESVDDDELKKIFLRLPERVRYDAHQWGLGDTVFRYNAYVFLKGKK